MEAVRAKIREYEVEIKHLDEHKRALEELVLAQLDDLGIDKASGAKASVAVSEKTVPTVKDWDAFYTYILRKKAFHLLERRPAVAAWREEVESRKGDLVPGTESFVKRTLNLRSL